MVPLIQGPRLVDPLVALEPDQFPVDGAGDGLGEFGLADPGRAFDEEGLGEPVGEEDGRRDGIGGEIAGRGEPGRDVVDRGESRWGSVGDRPPPPRRPTVVRAPAACVAPRAALVGLASVRMTPPSGPHYDILVIGAGSGRMVLNDAVVSGRHTAIVDRGAYGGTCLNRGCIPSKMFVHAAEVAATIRDAARFGIDARLDGVRWADIRGRVFGRIRPVCRVRAGRRARGGDRRV